MGYILEVSDKKEQIRIPDMEVSVLPKISIPEVLYKELRNLARKICD